MYKRILLKLSGEQLSGKHEFGIDTDVVDYLAIECQKVVDAGCQMVIIIGGGNVVRGAELAGNGIKRVTADQMGMLSGLMNAMAVTDIFESHGLSTRCMSNVFAEQVAESYTFRLAEKHLERGRVVIVAGGMGRPYFTHDSAAVNIGLELDCEVVIKATKVDGVYSKDPNKFDDAKRFDVLHYEDAVANPDIKVMDKAALGLAMEMQMSVIVLDAMQENNLVRTVRGERIGTYVSN